MNRPIQSFCPAHRLLLKSTTPLLQSRNSAVVLSIASLYFHVAPVSEFGTVVKSLLRIARSSRESQFVILTNISSMAAERPGVFRPYFKVCVCWWHEGTQLA